MPELFLRVERPTAEQKRPTDHIAAPLGLHLPICRAWYGAAQLSRNQGLDLGFSGWWVGCQVAQMGRYWYGVHLMADSRLSRECAYTEAAIAGKGVDRLRGKARHKPCGLRGAVQIACPSDSWP